MDQLKTTRVAFGLYEADLRTGELWKAGRKVRLQTQPFKVLGALLDNPGEVITRAELQTLLWGKDAVGEFDQSIGTAVNKIRDALGDHADNPRFVETLARRGYRFIAPVTRIEPELHPAPQHEVPLTAASHEPPAPQPAPEASPEPLVSQTFLAAPPQPGTATSRSTRIWWAVGASVVVAFFGGGFASRYLPHGDVRATSPLLRVERLTHIGKIAPGMPGMESLPASATDGLRLFVPVLVDGRSVLTRVDVHTGATQSVDLPREIASPMLGDISPDQSTLLLRNHLSPESEQPLWLAPASGGSALRLPNVIAHDATWMPDGRNVLYAAGNQLMIARVEDGSSTHFATLPGRALWLRWSPDGSLLRFTMLDPLLHTMQLWQIDSSGKNLRAVFDRNSVLSSACCGVWADAGKYFVFQANLNGHSDLWRLNGSATSHPVQVTDGPLDFAAPVANLRSSQIYFLGLDAQSKLEHFDTRKSRFVPEDDFLSDASRLQYSRDGKWVVWVDQAGRAWRAQADGSERIQLTSDSLQVFMAQWSPDGQQIALMAREPRGAWQLYLVPAEGGSIRHLSTGVHNAGDPSWSADGKQIVFGRLNDVMGDEGETRSLEIMDLATGATATIPGSNSLFSPRWSPDGRYIVALSLDQHQLLLYEVSTKHWRTLAQTTAADPVWASNSASIYFHASLAETQPIYRISIPDGKLQEIANLSSFDDSPTDYFFSGLTLGDTPVVRSRTATGDLYSLDLDEHPKKP